MLRSETRLQPAGGPIVNLLHAALAEPRYTSLDAAVAYATASGVEALRSGHGSNLDRLSRRWLSGFDWCRSDPVALQALDQPARSAVRIFQGKVVVERQGCTPRVPYHPKGFLFSGPGARLLVSGSGNLSRSGITRGIELNTVIEVHDPTTIEELAAWNALKTVQAWFDSTWASAHAYASLHDRYRAAFASASNAPPPTDDDWSTSSLIGRGYSEPDLVKMRRATVFWIEAGNLTENLGRGNPGNQLMMRALSRVFFGFPPTDIPKQTAIGTVDIRYEGTLTTGLSIEFAHNGMDRLNLPKPGSAGPEKYDREMLVLEKAAHQGRVIHILSLASPTEGRNLKRKSRAAASAFAMPGQGRQFGFFS